MDAHSKTVEIRRVINDHPASLARALCAYVDFLVSFNDKRLLREAERVYQEENAYRRDVPYCEAKTRFYLREDERTGRGRHGLVTNL